jgi:hypothetical protein
VPETISRPTTQARLARGMLSQAAWLTPTGALMPTWLPVSGEEAGLETTNAIAYAPSHHAAWFWSGVGG